MKIMINLFNNKSNQFTWSWLYSMQFIMACFTEKLRSIGYLFID